MIYELIKSINMSRDVNLEFKQLMQSCTVPFFKNLGFKKSNLNFNRTTNELVQCVSIQKSQWNHSERITFTINLGFYNEALFRISKNRVNQSKFIKVDDCFVWGRSGHLIYNHDYWYELNIESNLNVVQQQVTHDLDHHIRPLFEEIQTLSSLIDLLRLSSENRPFKLTSIIYDRIVLELEFGDFEWGSSALLNEYNEAMIPTSTSHKTVYPDGREEVRWSEPSVNSFAIEKLKRIALHYKIKLE